MTEGKNNSTRRRFLTQTGVATAGLSLGAHPIVSAIRSTLNEGRHVSSDDQPRIMIGFIWTIGDIGGAAQFYK